jgi:hypothetical protein
VAVCQVLHGNFYFMMMGYNMLFIYDITLQALTQLTVFHGHHNILYMNSVSYQGIITCILRERNTTRQMK